MLVVTCKCWICWVYLNILIIILLFLMWINLTFSVLPHGDWCYFIVLKLLYHLFRSSLKITILNMLTQDWSFRAVGNCLMTSCISTYTFMVTIKVSETSLTNSIFNPTCLWFHYLSIYFVSTCWNTLLLMILIFLWFLLLLFFLRLIYILHFLNIFKLQ